MDKKATDTKNIKKSTPQQLKALVEYMERHPAFAKGASVFGCSRRTVEDEWRLLADKLNSIGPPTRTAVEWKKTWADLKSRTKKKIAHNKNSMLQTGGGEYSVNNLTLFEEAIDRTLCLSMSATPEGKDFGPKQLNESLDSCFVTLIETPPRTKQSIAVVTPTRQTARDHSPPQCSKRKNEDVLAGSAQKVRRTVENDQLCLIRRQLEVSEKAAAAAEKQAAAAEKQAAAAEKQASAAMMMADGVLRIALAVEKVAESTKRSADSIEECVQKLSGQNEFNFDLR